MAYLYFDIILSFPFWNLNVVFHAQLCGVYACFLNMNYAFSALTLLVGRQEGHPACKNWVVGAGVVICLEPGADLHMAQLMSLPLTVSCSSKIQIGFPFLVRLTWVVLDKGPLSGCMYVCSEYERLSVSQLASEVTTLWRTTNTIIIILLFLYPR